VIIKNLSIIGHACASFKYAGMASIFFLNNSSDSFTHTRHTRLDDSVIKAKEIKEKNV
jgi:hypothetical protein